MCSLGWLIGQNILGFNSRMDNVQQRIYVLESMARQGEASSSNMKELFKLQTRVKAKERFLKISYEDA